MPVHIIVKDTRTMDITIDQQVAWDEALVPHASRLRIGKSNFRLRSDITSKESTLQLEFWATATVHHHSIRFKMDNRKRIVNLEYFREMMHICLRLSGQTFDDLPFEEEILAFLRFLRHSGEIRKLTDGMYHKKNVDFAYLLWEDFVYQVKHKDAKKINEMYYPRFTKVIIHYFMTNDSSIARRNKVKWHYVRDDQMFTTIKLVSRHQNTQQFGVMLPIELTNKDNRNSEAYKEYYAVALGAAPSKTKASVRKTKSSSDTTITPPTGAGVRLSTSAKGKQPAKASKAKSLTMLYEKSSDEDDDDVDEGSDDQDDDDDHDDDDQDKGNDDDQDIDDEGDEFIHPKFTIHEEEKTKDEESFDPIIQTPENSDDEGNDDANLGLNVGSKEGQDAKDDEDELYRDVNINLEGRDVQMTDVHTTQEFEDTHVTLTLINPDGQQQSSSVSSQFVTSMLNLTPDAGIDCLFETTYQMDVLAPTTVASLTLSAPTLTPPTIPTSSQVQQAPTPPITALSTLLQDLLNFGSLFRFDHRLKTLETNFSEFMQTNQFVRAISSILEIVQRYMDQWMNKANLDENIQKIIKEQVKEQVKVQVSKILPKIEKTVNEQLEAEVLTCSSNSSKTSYAIAADLSEMVLKKILIEKMESNKSIHRSDEQRNLYKALVEAYESNKINLDTYGDIVTLKRRHDDDADKDKEPSTGSDRGSKRRREGKEPKSTSAPKEKATKTTGKSKQGRVIPFDHFINNDLEYLRGGASSHKYITSVTKTNAADYGHIKWIEDLVPHTMWSQEPVSYEKHALWGISHWGRKHQQFYGFAVNRESARDVYSKRRIITVTELQIVDWHNYKHLDWITVRRDDEKLYKFKEGDFKMLCIQDIKDMLLLLVQGKLTNLTVEECFAFNVSLRMFTRSIVTQRHVEDLQLGRSSRIRRLLKHERMTKPYSPHRFIANCFNAGHLKMEVKAIWRKSDKERAAAAMIQAIDKQLKMRRIMRSLEKFVGGRLYEGDFRMLQQTI
nr:hypothetical protein [Tanacetum cinerariifolium]